MPSLLPRPILSPALLLVLAAFPLCIAACADSPARGGIAPRGGTPMKRFHIGLNPIYRQNDPLWSEQKLGGSGERFGSVGCVVCSVSMALAELGVQIRPDSLNRALDAADGFTKQGWLRWEVVEEVTDGRAEIEVVKAPDHATIDEALRAGHPVLAKVLVGRGIPHWVLIAGKDGSDYLIKDPLGDGTRLDVLADYNSNVHAIRIVSPS